MLGLDRSPGQLEAEPRKRPMQARSVALVERVLDEAARLFESTGYHATTTNHVAEAAGVSVGSLYQYFPNKDALLVGLVERHLDEAVPAMLELAAGLRESQPDAEQFAALVVGAVLDLNRSDQLHHLLWSAPRTAALDERLAAMEEVLVSELTWHLQRLGHDDEVAAVRAQLLSTVIDAAVHNIVSTHDRSDQERELQRLVTIYLASP
ncbi:MAG: TetR/AcrR family transcriptional regulator [Actinomycetota bacterium]